MKKKFCVVLAMFLILFAMTGSQLINVNSNKAEPLENLCNDELQDWEASFLKLLQFPYRPLSFPEEKNEYNTTLYEIALNGFQNEEIEAAKKTVVDFVKYSPILDVQYYDYDESVRDFLLSGGEEQLIDSFVAQCNGTSGLSSRKAIEQQLKETYPDLKEEQTKEIFALRFANEYSMRRKKVLYFREAQIAGLIDESAPKLTLQKAEEIIDKYRSGTIKDCDVLKEFLETQPYPDELFSNAEEFTRSNIYIPIVEYVRFQSENEDGGYDEIWVQSGVIFHFKLDKNHNIITINKLASITNQNEYFFQPINDPLFQI